MVEIRENKVLSVVTDDGFSVEYDGLHYLNPHVFFIDGESKELIEVLEVTKEPTTIEELKEIALDWHQKCVGESRIVETLEYDALTLEQLDLHSQSAMMVTIKDTHFIIGEEVPMVRIIQDNEVVAECLEPGIEDQISTLSELERYAIKWYYENALGMEF